MNVLVVGYIIYITINTVHYTLHYIHYTLYTIIRLLWRENAPKVSQRLLGF